MAKDYDVADFPFVGPPRWPSDDGPARQPFTAAEREALHRDPDYLKAAADHFADVLAWQREQEWTAAGDLRGDDDFEHDRAGMYREYADDADTADAAGQD